MKIRYSNCKKHLAVVHISITNKIEKQRKGKADPVKMGFLNKSSGGQKAIATGGMGMEFKDDL